MVIYRYGGRKGRAHELELDPQVIVVRTHSRTPLREGRVGRRARQVLAGLETLVARLTGENPRGQLLIERAKGVVMRRLCVDEQEAFQRMKRFASNNNRWNNASPS